MWYQLLAFYSTTEPESACFYFKTDLDLDGIMKDEKLMNTLISRIEEAIPETFHVSITKFLDLKPFDTFNSDLLIAPDGKILIDFGDDNGIISTKLVH